jgi:hypothetical protein
MEFGFLCELRGISQRPLRLKSFDFSGQKNKEILTATVANKCCKT